MAKTQIKNYVFKPGIGVNDNRYPNAYNLLSANKTFIQKEATAWIQDQIDAGAAGFIGYTYNQSKCERDIGYVIDAYLNDLRYGGNEKLRNTIKYYWDQDVAQVDGDRQPEIQTHTFIGDLIKDYIFTQTVYSASNLEVTQTTQGSAVESTVQFTPSAASYTPTTGNMTLTIGTHNLSLGDEIFIAPNSLTFTCGLDDNATTHSYPRASGVPNSTGKDPFYYAPVIITAATSTTITVNIGISSDTSTHTFVSALANAVTSGPSAKINTLAFNTVDVITNGLIAQPTFVPVGVGTVKIQGRYSVDELLLITNSTRSEVIYNFTNLGTGASIEIVDGASDTDFVKYLQTTDAVTTIRLNYNTSLHSADDDIQIFVEEKEVRTRPYDFGTDAIERMRIAPPLSMLDADFEYGLQPTKWSAIGTLRGYPSVYEIPGTDTEVLSVITDASLSEPTQVYNADVTNSGTSAWSWSNAADRLGNVTGTNPTITLYEGDTINIRNNATSTHPFYIKTTPGTGTSNQVSSVLNNGASAGGIVTWVTQPGSAGTYYYQCATHASMVGTITILPNTGGTGIGQSLITVTTTGAHGFEAGTPISIKALENSVAGASRAEGTFVIVNVPSVTTFQYFAKAKVGTSSGEVLSTGYTQLREAGFYTGASIGAPTFTISSNGSSGTMFTQLGVLTGSTVIPFDGQSPELGSPLTQANIPVGSQVTGIIDQSSGGGTYITPLTNSNTPAGQNQMEFQNIAGVIPNLAVDRGDGNAIHIISIDGNTATFNANFTDNIVGNRHVYTNVVANNQQPNGSLAEFDIAHAGDSSFTYVINAIENDGIQYEIGDRIKILGTDLGGTTPENDAIITVTEIGSANSIAAATISGTHFNNDIYLPVQSANFTGGLGTNAQFDIEFLDGVYTSVTASANNAGSGYKVGDVVVISGSSIVFSVVGNSKDLYISVDAVETVGGQVTSISSPLNPGVSGYIDATGVATTGGTGSGLTVDITTTAGQVTGITVNNLGTGYSELDVITITGGDGTATFRVLSVRELGAITSLTFAGDAPQLDRTFTNVAYTSTTASGTGAVIDVQVTGASYTATFTNEGTNYLPTETITVAGTELGGVSPGNDLTITIDNVGGTGNITQFTETGVTYNGNTVTQVGGDNRIPSGANFNISQNTDGAFVVDVNNPGSGYNTGMELIVSGTLFGGTSPANDLTITVATIDQLNNGTISTITTSGAGYIPIGTYLNVSGTNIPAVGSGAEFSLIRTNGVYQSITIPNGGINYQIGDRLQIPGGALDGVSPLNDLNLSVFEVGASGEITIVTPSFVEASFGNNVDLISTVTMTEPTTGAITQGLPITFSAIATLEAQFQTAHGLVPGDTFITSITSDDGVNNHNLAAGSYIATEIPTVDSLRFQARTVGAIDITTDDITGQVYPRPDSFFVHRPFDGGVQLGTGGPQHGAQAIRQSKKYIRYQSGKGIMYTTGALFAPSYDLRSVTANGIEVGSEITITCDDNDHGLQIGGIIRLLGIETPGYNSGNETAVPPKFDYEVTEIINERTFKVLAQRRLGATDAVLGFGAQMSVVSWHGATVRSGIFDDQNGIFWEYDGTQISVVQRTGTYQVAGTVAIDTDTNLLTGTNTRFRDQLKAGDRIIIRGMTHVVSHVNSQTELTVTPDWRGVTNITGAKAMLVFDKKVKQSEFNLDRLDGTGPSGYDIDIAKMQMIGIQYSWYGAGFIDFMLRGADGNFVFAHRMRNSNINTEAFMRSGNLPVRYEVTNEGPSGKLAASIDASQTTLTLEDSSFFPENGTIYIDNEIISFTGNDKSTNTLTGLVRAATYTNFQGGAQRSYTAGVADIHTAKTGVILISNTITPLISHWGSAFLTDGGFDEDRGYIFSYAATGIEVSTTRNTAFMIRLAPSVSNAIVGDLGERELLNRAQLLLQGLEVTSDTGTGGIVIQGVLNPQNYPLDPGSVSWSGLSGLAQGGQPSFAQIAPGGAINWNGGATLTTVNVPVSTDIQTPVYTPLEFGTNENNSPIELTNAVYDAVGEIYTGVLLYGNNPSDVYTGGPNGDYIVTEIRRGGRTDIFFRAANGSTRRARNWTGTPEIYFVQPTYTGITNRLIFSKAAWESGGATSGTAVSTSDTNWPAGTAVSGVELKTLGGIQFYEVLFNQSSIAPISAGQNVVFEFGNPPYAQPGETVFSFIANPGERSTLDLSELKELTNTPLGGRGTFPNGPDVLAINIYKISGTALDANIILKWGEAQA